MASTKPKLSLDAQLTAALGAVRSVSLKSEVCSQGVSVPEMRVLEVLSRRPTRFADILVQASIDKGQLSRTLRGMKERGLIARTTAKPSIASALQPPALLRLTVRGKRLRDALVKRVQIADKSILRQLEPEERAVLPAILEKLAKVA